MGWFSFLFWIAITIAILTRKAYFRGVISQDENPKQFWTVVACYFVLATIPWTLMKLSRLKINNISIKNGIIFLISDAATRVAYDLEDASREMKWSHLNSYTLNHKQWSWPGGCKEKSRIQLSANAGLLVWCLDKSGKITSSHITTYHLNFVDVPKTLSIDKDVKEMVHIKMIETGSKPQVIDLN